MLAILIKYKVAQLASDILQIFQIFEVDIIQQKSHQLMASQTNLNFTHHKTNRENLCSSTHNDSHSKMHPLLKQSSFRSSSEIESDRQQQIKTSINSQMKAAWSLDQDSHLISLFNSSGANWAEISKLMKNRSPKELSSRFYVILRKIIQKINKQLKEEGCKQIKFKKMKSATELTSEYSMAKEDYLSIIKDETSRLIYSFLTDNQNFHKNNPEKCRKSVSKIQLAFKKNHKRKSVSKASTDIYLKQQVQFQNLQGGYVSDSSSAFEQIKQELPLNIISKNRQVFADEQEPSQKKAISSHNVLIEEDEEKIKNLLLEYGLLQQECAFPGNEVNYEELTGNISQNLNNQSHQLFYDQNQLQSQCYWKINLSQLGNSI